MIAAAELQRRNFQPHLFVSDIIFDDYDPKPHFTAADEWFPQYQATTESGRPSIVSLGIDGPDGSETSPQEILPVPLRPMPFLRSPPSNNGSRRQQTRQDTQETLWSPPFEDIPLKPLNVTSTPSVSKSPEPPVSPMRSHQPAPGGGVGGFPSTPNFTTHSDSGSPRYETAGISEGIHAGIWPIYNKASQEFDEKRTKKWNKDLDILLIFGALWSALVAASLVRSLDNLQPDYQQQTALLLYQSLNGRDPDLANISDPTINKPNDLTVAVNCFWAVSLAFSITATGWTVPFKRWLTEYNGGPNPVSGLLRACRRHTRYTGLDQSNFQARVALLSTFLIHSIALWFTGAIIYACQLNTTVAIVLGIAGGILCIAYVWLFISPSINRLPLFNYPTPTPYRPPFTIGKVVTFIVDRFASLCCLTLRCLTGGVLFPFIQALTHTEVFHRDNPTQGEQEDQEQAILWLSQVPLDPSESEALVSNLALISSSRPCKDFQKPVVAIANLVLEASLREKVGRELTDTATNCVLVLGNIKFQSAVDRNLDCDHNVGGIPVPPSAAWAAQQLATSALQANLDDPHFEGNPGRLLAAAAWLSPVGGAEDVEWDGQEMKIQDRSHFIEEIRMMLKRHIRSDNPPDKKVLIDLIHGMHACIPRSNHGSASSIVPFLSFFCEDYDSPWSKDEAVLGALITYALDLVLPPYRRKPLVGRKIDFDDLVSELIGALMVNTTHSDALMDNTTYSDVVTFAFWLAYHVPYAFRSRETVLTDIACIWLQTNPEDYRERLNLRDTETFIAVAQHHVVANRGLPRLTDYAPLELLSVALESGYNQQMTIYTMAMILTLSPSTKVTTVTSKIEVEPVTHALFSGSSDLEKGVTEEEVDTRIYSALILLKLSPTVELDVEKVKGLIVQMEEAIGDPSVRNLGVAKDSEVDIGVDLGRARWKAIYLSGLLFKFLPGDEREKYIEGLWMRVRALLGSGDLSFMGDYRRCLKPFGMDVSELGTPAAEQQGQMETVFEGWIGGFPLFRLAGAVSWLPPGQMHNSPSFFNPRQWFG